MHPPAVLAAKLALLTGLFVAAKYATVGAHALERYARAEVPFFKDAECCRLTDNRINLSKAAVLAGLVAGLTSEKDRGW